MENNLSFKENLTQHFLDLTKGEMVVFIIEGSESLENGKLATAQSSYNGFELDISNIKDDIISFRHKIYFHIDLRTTLTKRRSEIQKLCQEYYQIRNTIKDSDINLFVEIKTQDWFKVGNSIISINDECRASVEKINEKSTIIKILTPGVNIQSIFNTEWKLEN